MNTLTPYLVTQFYNLWIPQSHEPPCVCEDKVVVMVKNHELAGHSHSHEPLIAAIHTGGRDWEDDGLKSAWVKLSETPPSQLISWVWLMHLPSQLHGRWNRGIATEADLGKNESSYLKNKAKNAGGIVQVVEHLPSKCEVMNSNTSTMKKFFLVISKPDLKSGHYH
jgi:hypothetical protein